MHWAQKGEPTSWWWNWNLFISVYVIEFSIQHRDLRAIAQRAPELLIQIL